MSLTVEVDPADMLLFASVVREGGFTRAARRAGVSKQTVSERIARLEARLGVRLLERTTRSVRCTDAGAAYHERCAAIAAQIEDANAAVRERQAEVVGWLRVSAPALFGRRFLAPVLREYLGQNPRASVEVVLADRRVNLIEEGFDLAIRVGPLDDSDLAARRLGDGFITYVAAPSFLRRHRHLTPEGLASVRCIGVSRSETWAFGGAARKVAPTLVVTDLEVACEAAVSGLGVARLPSLVCREAVLRGDLAVAFPDEPPLRRPVHVLYPSRQYLPAKVRAFLESLSRHTEPMTPLPAPRRTTRITRSSFRPKHGPG